MFRKLKLGQLFIVLLAGLAAGCKHSTGPASSSGYFKTSFQDESQFIVEAIVSDLAEQMFYSKYQRLPDQKYFLVIATEKPGSPPDAPVYELQICLDAKHPALKSEVAINGSIWSPEVYQDVAQALAGAVGLTVGISDPTEDTKLLSKLTDGTAETIEKEDEKLSGALENDFTDPVLHHKYPAITATTSTGYVYRLVRSGFEFSQPVLPEGFPQTRSRSKSVAIATS